MSNITAEIEQTMHMAGYHQLSIIPVKQNKQPAIKWKQYQTERPSLLDMSAWLKNAKTEGIALVTGQISGVLVLDIDTKKGKNGFHSIGRKHLPVTATATTQNGGIHYYYKLPKGKTYGNINGLYDGVDVKCEGGYVLMPQTAGYEWAEGLEFNGVDNLADIPDWLLNELEEKETKREQSKKQGKGADQKSKPKPQPAPTAPINSNQPRNGRDDIINYFKDYATVRNIMAYLGIDADVQQPFNCILPSDSPDNNPSASITQGNNGVFVYRDWRDNTEERKGTVYTLPEVYASMHYNQKKKLSKAEHATWSLKLLADMGILKTEKITAHPLHEQLMKKPTVKKVYDGFIQLIEVKKLYNAEQNNTAFSYRFASAWCGVSSPSAQSAMKLLETFGYIERAGKEGKSQVNTYKLTK